MLDTIVPWHLDIKQRDERNKGEKILNTANLHMQLIYNVSRGTHEATRMQRPS